MNHFPGNATNMRSLLSLICSALFLIGSPCAQAADEPLLDKQTRQEIFEQATAGIPGLGEVMFPQTTAIEKLSVPVDFVREGHRANALLARALWPHQILIEKCRIEESPQVKQCIANAMVEVREVIRPYEKLAVQLEQRKVCANLPTASGLIGKVDLSDRILWRLVNDSVKIELQDDGFRTHWLIVPRNSRMPEETLQQFAVRVLREITTLPQDVDVEVKFHTQGERPIMSGEMKGILTSKIRADDRKWYESASLAVHSKFVYLSVAYKKERRNHSRANFLFGFPDRF